MVTDLIYVQDPVALIEKDANFFTKYTHVIANDVPEVPLLKLSKVLWDHHIPLVITRAYGFIGMVRVAVPEHTSTMNHALRIR